MARTSYIEIPEAMIDNFNKVLKSGDRFQFAKIVRNDTLLSRKRKSGLTQRSLLPQVAELWSDLSDVQVANWGLAAAEMGLNGWQLFVQDQCIRIINDIPGSATPSLFHQSWVGALAVASPADEITIAQFHPLSYWIKKKVRGIAGLYQPVLVTEPFALPLELSINYKVVRSDSLVPEILFYAVVRSSYQGREEEHVCAVTFNYVDEVRQNGIASISYVRGTLLGYTLFISATNFHGTIYIDNIKATHSGQNWARDPYCKNIDETFTRNYYQVPKHWVAVELPNGAEFDSIYLP